MVAAEADEAAFGEHATLEQLAPSAVAAVLETLAAHERKHRFGYPMHDLRRLAAEVKSEEARP